VRIGGYRIEGVSRRFWWILGAFAAFVLFCLYLLASRPAPSNPLVDPAFPTAKLSRLDADWIGPYVSQYGLQRPETASSFTTNFGANVGLPFRFRAYIPSPEVLQQRKNLNLIKYGWTFVPSIFIDPTETLTPDELAQGEQIVQNGQPLVLGFRQAKTPAPGRAYEMTGLLYWNSNQLKPPGDEQAGSELPNSPVVLVSSAQQLSAAELRAPTTHRVDLNLTYQEHEQQLNVDRVEWSAGHELRVCIALSNVGKGGPLDVWPGVSEMSADTGGGSNEGQPDSDTALGSQDQVEQGQTVTGYIVFPSSPGDPAQPLTLRMPALAPPQSQQPASEVNNEIIVHVDPRQVKDVSQASGLDHIAENPGCFSQSGALTGGDNSVPGNDVTLPPAAN
jgi:hypothetical protein